MIIYFSGTGNSLWVAQQLATELNEQLISAAEALHTGNMEVSLKAGERLGFVFPCYSWGPAPVITEFIEKMQLSTMPSFCFMVTTCGDDIGLTADILAKQLSKRDITLQAAYSVQMPNTYINMKGFDVDSDIVRMEKLHAAPARVAQIAQKVAEGRIATDVVTGSWPWAKSHIIRPWFLKNAMSDKKFHADAALCTHCGACEHNCPLHNITLSDSGLPKWNGHCTMCSSCMHRCPAKAINYGKATQNKGRYFFKKQN